VVGRANVSLALTKFLILLRFDFIEPEPAYNPFFDVESVASEMAV